MNDDAIGQVIAGVAMGGLVVAMWQTRRDTYHVARQEVTVASGTVQRTVEAGGVVPPDITFDEATMTKVDRSWLSGLVVGKDHRASTSKTVSLAWTIVIAYGLLALILAKWLPGDSTGWTDQLGDGIQSDYLVLLGGPYAAAVFAKLRTSAESDDGGKPPDAPGNAKVNQLVSDDEGDTSLPDFQYVLFNAIAIVYFLGEFSGNLDNGFPDLPDLLSGLVLTSAVGYSAGKLVAAAKPTLTSVLPVAAAPATPGVRIYGQSLVIPPLVPPDGTAQPAIPPDVVIGGKMATVAAHQVILGADVLTVTLHAAATKGAGVATVVRADGVPAVGPAGSDGIAFTVT